MDSKRIALDGKQDHPHACMDGWVFVGHLVEDSSTGEEVEIFEALPCRRCDLDGER
jgi:hypothetical protein